MTSQEKQIDRERGSAGDHRETETVGGSATQHKVLTIPHSAPTAQRPSHSAVARRATRPAIIVNDRNVLVRPDLTDQFVR